jgi:hypothetical protein
MTMADLANGILGRFAELRERCPEMRFGQILATVGLLAEDETGHSLWDVEDIEFLAALERFAGDLARSRPDLAEQSHAPEPAAGLVSNGESSPPAR